MLNTSLKRLASIAVKHDEAKLHFVGDIAGIEGQCTMKYRYLSEKQVDFFTTVTDHSLQGKGVAAKVVGEACGWAQSKNLKVKPTCSYVESFIKKNPQLLSLLNDSKL